MQASKPFAERIELEKCYKAFNDHKSKATQGRRNALERKRFFQILVYGLAELI